MKVLDDRESSVTAHLRVFIRVRVRDAHAVEKLIATFPSKKRKKGTIGSTDISLTILVFVVRGSIFFSHSQPAQYKRKLGDKLDSSLASLSPRSVWLPRWVFVDPPGIPSSYHGGVLKTHVPVAVVMFTPPVAVKENQERKNNHSPWWW